MPSLSEPSSRSSSVSARTLVIGGARSGKSTYAERLLAAEPAVTYVATGGRRDDDPEWVARIKAHQQRRPVNWTTQETTDLVTAFDEAREPLLIDCLTLWLTATMDELSAWDDATWHQEAGKNLVDRIDQLVVAYRAADVPVVVVTNEVGLGIVPETPAGRRFRDEQGRLNQRMAAASESVVLMTAGIPLTIR